MRGLFVTGTGTDIGKTYVSAAIARELTKKKSKISLLQGCSQWF